MLLIPSLVKGYKISIDPISCYRTVTYWQPTEFLSRTKVITKLIVRSTGFGDVEVLSDLFLRERLERLHVPHRLDVVPPEVGFLLHQSQSL